MWARAKALFNELVDLPPAEQARALAAEPDEAVRAEVASLLAAETPDAGVLDTPALVRPGGFSIFHDQELPYATIGPYRVVALIGHGGMGTVYLGARADEAFHKQVAIKVVKRGMDTADILARFRRERETLARLEHPNIARLLDGGTTSDGLPYVVMEFVEGTPIDVYCREHRLTVGERLQLFRTVCGALHYAHQNLVLHRDLKPDNILVTRDGEPKLLDFGIAKLLRPDGDTTIDSTATRTVGRLMTLRYASPEQVKGEPLSTASDVYSLGVLLYELLTERRPYVALEPGEAGWIKVICDIDPDAPSVSLVRPPDARRPAPSVSPAPPAAAPSASLAPSPSSFTQPLTDLTEPDVQGLRRALAGDLDMIVLMALRKEPARRYHSAEQLAEDLRRHLRGFPVTARADTVWYRVGKFARRHRAGVVTAVLVGVLLAGALAAVAWQARVAARDRDLARREARRAERISEFLRTTLAAADPNELGRDVTVLDALDRASGRVEAELAGDPDTLAAVRHTVGRTYLELGAYDKAEAHLRGSLTLVESLPTVEPSERVAIHVDLAGAFEAAGSFDEADAVLTRALAVARESGGEENALFASVQNALGSLRQAQGRHAEAEAIHRRNLTLRRTLSDEDDLDVATTLNNLAVTVGSQGRWEEAVPLHRECLEVVKRVRGVNNPDVAAAMTALASALEAAKQYDEADAMFREALEIRKRLLGPEHPLVAWTLNNYAFLLYAQGKYRETIAMLAPVFTMRGRTLADSHPMVGASLIVTGQAWMKLGEARAAEPFLRDALAVRRASLPEGHWLLANTEGWLGECLLDQGRIGEARSLIEASHTRLVAALGNAHERTRESLARLERLRNPMPVAGRSTASPPLAR